MLFCYRLSISESVPYEATTCPALAGSGAQNARTTSLRHRILHMARCGDVEGSLQ